MGRRVQRRRLVNDALDPKPAPGEIIKFELNWASQQQIHKVEIEAPAGLLHEGAAFAPHQLARTQKRSRPRRIHVDFAAFAGLHRQSECGQVVGQRRRCIERQIARAIERFRFVE